MDALCSLLKKSFYPLGIMFYVSGIDILTNPKSSSINKLYHCIINFPKYIFSVCMIYSIVSELMWSIVLSEKKSEVAVLCILLLQGSAHICVYRKRRHIVSGLRKLSQITTILLQPGDLRKYKLYIIAYSSLCNLALLAMASLLFMSYEKEEMLRQTCSGLKTYTGIRNAEEYCFLSRKINMFLFLPALSCMILPFVGYYSFMCVFLKQIFVKLELQLRKSTDQDCRKLLRIYEETIGVVSFVDEHFSYPAFVAVLTTMVGLFRAGYCIAFDPNKELVHNLYSYISGMFYLFYMLCVILAASSATEAARRAREVVLSLPGMFPSSYAELKVLVRNNLKRDVTLTLWNTYVIDRSLLVSAIGSLMTYGILVATFGNVQVENSDTGPSIESTIAGSNDMHFPTENEKKFIFNV